MATVHGADLGEALAAAGGSASPTRDAWHDSCPRLHGVLSRNG